MSDPMTYTPPWWDKEITVYNRFEDKLTDKTCPIFQSGMFFYVLTYIFQYGIICFLFGIYIYGGHIYGKGG